MKKDTRKKAFFHEARGVQSIQLDFPCSPNNVKEVKSMRGAVTVSEGQVLEGVRYIIESTEESIHIFIELVDIEEVGEMLECHMVRKQTVSGTMTGEYSFKRIVPKSVGMPACDEYVENLIRDYKNSGKDICYVVAAGSYRYDGTRMYHVNYMPGSRLMHIKGGEDVVCIANGVFKIYVSDIDGNNKRWIDKEELVHMNNC